MGKKIRLKDRHPHAGDLGYPTGQRKTWYDGTILVEVALENCSHHEVYICEAFIDQIEIVEEE